MAVSIPFPLPSTGYALNSKVRVNLDFIVSKFNEFNTGTATWDAVYIGTGGSVNGALTLYNSTNGYYTTIQSGVATANQTYTWPTAVPAGNGSLHTTNAGVLSWGQSVKTTDSPSFTGLTVSGTTFHLSSFTSGGLLYADALGDLQQLGFDSGKVLTSGASSYVYNSLTGTANQVTVTPSAGVFTFSTPQDIGTSSTVDFARVRLNSAGVATTPELVIYKSPSATNTGLYSTGSDIRFATAGTYAGAFDGTDFIVVQDIRAGRNFILEGAGGNITLANGASGGSYTLTLPANDGDSGQALVTNGSGTLSWATPSGTGANTTLSNLTDTVAINKNLNNFSAGTITASLTGAASLNLLLTGGTLSGHLTMASTKNIILTDGTTNTITLAAPSSVTSYTLTLPANDGDANQVLTTNGSGVTSWTTPGSGANTALSNLSSVSVNTDLLPLNNTIRVGTVNALWGETNAIISRAGTSGTAGSFRLYPSTASKGQTIITASDNTSDTITSINIAGQSDIRTYTIPDTGALTASFVMTEGAQTVNGSKTFGSPLIAPEGTVSAPSFTFTGDTNAGFYRVGADTVGVTLNSVKTVEFNPGSASEGTDGLPLSLFGNGVTNRFTTGSASSITTAKTIGLMYVSAALMLVCGNDGSGNSFVDLILALDSTVAPTVITSKTIAGSPAARTYTAASSTIKVAFASGTYSVKTVSWQLNGA